jgi:hypothetical protein
MLTAPRPAKRSEAGSSRPALRGYKATTVMVAERCDECRFWILGEEWGEQQQEHPNERRGGCHRNAPRPTMGDFEYRVLQALTLLVWEHEDYADLAKHWEDAPLQGAIWPTTTAEDFCGEFSKREAPC